MAQFTLTSSGWTKIASAGATVEVQNLSTYQAKLTISASAPSGGADYEVLDRIDSVVPIRAFSAPLPNDLYGMALTNSNAVIEVLSIGTSGSGSGPFVPVRGTTTALTVGPSATTAPVALPACTATSYRVRNAVASASPVTWTLAVNTTTPPVLPVAYSTAGTGGTVGDKSLDPGGVEVIGLSAAQQTALAAGTLYLSAICPASGSATLYITPGTGA